MSNTISIFGYIKVKLQLLRKYLTKLATILFGSSSTQSSGLWITSRNISLSSRGLRINCICDQASYKPTMSRLYPTDIDSIVSSYRNNRISVTPSTKDEIFYFAWPSHNLDELILEKDGFVISYNRHNKLANFACELVTSHQISKKIMSRKDFNTFYEDITIVSEFRLTPDDYEEPFVKGHLVPAADEAHNSTSYIDTFAISNTVPMYEVANDIFNRIEGVGRKLIHPDNRNGYELMYSVTGPVFCSERAPIYVREDNRLRVPDSIFKVMAHGRKDNRNKHVRAYEVKNSAEMNINCPLDNLKINLTSLKEKTGLNILGGGENYDMMEVLIPKRHRYMGH